MEEYLTLLSLMEEVESHLLAEWQWRYTGCGQGLWMQKLIPLVGVEVGEVDFYLSQALSSYGSFREFLFHFKKSDIRHCENAVKRRHLTMSFAIVRDIPQDGLRHWTTKTRLR